MRNIKFKLCRLHVLEYIHKINKIMPQSQFDEHVAIADTLRTAETTYWFIRISLCYRQQPWGSEKRKDM